MNDQSDLWNSVYPDSLSPYNNASNNTDTIYPKFGHYSSSTAALQCTANDTRVGTCNITQSVGGYPALVNDFYQNSRGATSGLSAFSSVSASNLAVPPSGDQAPHTSMDTTTTWATNVNDIVGSSLLSSVNGRLFEAQTTIGGYNSFTTRPYATAPFNGYTQGPGYWGKTFYIWPPDPRYVSGNTALQLDWRKRFFMKPTGSYPTFGGPMDDNSYLWDASGNFLLPPGNYVINYAAILSWIKSSPNAFPSQLRAGNIQYYSSIPNDVPSSAYDHTQSNANITDASQRFWKEYIDYALGVWRDPNGNVGTLGSYPDASMGPDFSWGTAQITAKPSPAGTAAYATGATNAAYSSGYSGAISTKNMSPLLTIPNPGDYIKFTGLSTYYTVASATSTSITLSSSLSTAVANSTSFSVIAVPYMNYNDNPLRPRHRFWFGPMTMMQYMLDTGIMPGTAHELQMYTAKLGIAGALTDIKNNHPGDLVSLCLFSRPTISGDPANTGRFTSALWNLSRDYTGMTNALWYPPNTTGSGASDCTPWDSNGVQTPRASHDYTYDTATSYGLRLAYNQLSCNSTLRTAGSGGLGRKGSQKLIILETDGMANVAITTNFTQSIDSTNNVNNSYYNISSTDTITLSAQGYTTTQPSPSATDATNVATKMCALYNDTTTGPGFATSTKPVTIHCLAFGSVFESTATGTEATQALSLLQTISTTGGTGFPSSVTATTDPNFYKLITGSQSHRQANLRTAFDKIMSDEVAIVMVQ
jgi:hypothetical protein